MVDSINKVNANIYQANSALNNVEPAESNMDKSIFLEEALKEVNDKQGFIGKAWNGVKETFNAGLSEDDCEDIIKKYKNGEVSYKEALETIKSYDNKQSTMSDLFTNIVTGIASIAVATSAVAAGPIGWLTAALIGAPTGAVVKSGLKIVDRSTNNIKDDEFDTKAIAKDLISGAITGTTSAVSSGIGAGIKTGKLALSVKNGAKCGAICGGVSGASSYLTDVAFEDDKYFNAADLAKTTITSAFVSGTVGAAVGGAVYGVSNPTSYASQTVNQTIVNDSISSSSRKVLGNFEKEALGIIKA